MSNDQMLVIYADMLDMFGALPDYVHEPIKFAYYVKLYNYYKSRAEEQKVLD